MSDPKEKLTDTSPDQASTGGVTPSQSPVNDPDQNASGNPEATTESTQENMGDGKGIRGDYGNPSKTTGMEGGPDTPKTDTELTGS
jgi:hypothetical protein